MDFLWNFILFQFLGNHVVGLVKFNMSGIASVAQKCCYVTENIEIENESKINNKSENEPLINSYWFRITKTNV